jgi:uncharacterized protein
VSVRKNKKANNFQQKDDQRPMMCRQQQTIIDTVGSAFPDVEAVYLFGSFNTVHETRDSDVDVAILLPPERAKRVANSTLRGVRFDLESELKRDVDLINLRMVNVVFRHEIIKDARRIYSGDSCAADEFEMMTMSFYQKLNEERAAILDEIAATGRVLAP